MNLTLAALEMRRVAIFLTMLMLAALLVLPTGPARAAVAVPTCEGTTATPAGAINTPGSFVLTGQQEADYNDGKAVSLYDSKGQVIANAAGGYTTADVRVPLCAVAMTPDGPVAQWRFCTDEALSGCAGEAPVVVAENPRLSPDQESIIAVIVGGGDQATKRGRTILQMQVWCISEGFVPGSIANGPRNYFNTYQFDNSAPGDPNSASITNAEATCYDQAYRDAAIATIPVTPTMSVTGPAGNTQVDDEAEFVLTTNFLGEVDLTVTGAASIALCADDTSGASLAGGVLTLTKTGDVRLCGVRTSAGDLVLSAAGRALSRGSLGWRWNGNAGCQVFTDFTGGLVDVAMVQAAAPFVEPRVSLGDLVWIDANSNGQFDQDESPIQGVTVTLTDAAGNSVVDADGNPVAATSTDANGRYSFTELLEGDYRVVFTLPAGYSWTVANTGNDGLDSDAVATSPTAATATTDTFTLTRDQVVDADTNEFVRNVTNPTIDAGVVLTPVVEPVLYAVGDFVWFDNDKDGVQDAAELPVEGMTVELLDADGVVVATTTTDADGFYIFDELPAGDYSIKFSDVPAGYQFTTQAAGGDQGVDSNPNPGTGVTPVFTLGEGETNVRPTTAADGLVADFVNPTIDAGLILTPVKVEETPKTKPVVTTVASSQQLLVGTKVHDAVIVKGLPAGAKTTAVARLYGPKSTEGQLNCAGAAYASVKLAISGNGTFNTPKVTVNKPGWYSWKVTLAEGPLSLSATEGCGEVKETMLVTRPKPIVPTVPTGFVGIDPQVAARRAGPADSVKINAIGVNATMSVSGLRGKSMAIPKSVKQTAWYDQSAHFGDVIGSAVVAGHVSDKHDSPGAFFRLSRLKKGAVISVVRDGKTYRYKVTAKHKHLRAKPLPARYFTNTGAAQLQLITCTDKKVFGNGRFHYTKNLVITAKLIG